MRVVTVALVVAMPLALLGGCAKRCCPTPCGPTPVDACARESGCK